MMTTRLTALLLAMLGLMGCAVGGPLPTANTPSPASSALSTAAGSNLEQTGSTRSVRAFSSADETSTQPASLEIADAIGKDSFGKYVRGHDGERLRLHVWPAKGDERVAIVAVHGYGDHASSTYAEAAEVWSEHGATVYAYDQRGFGRNRSRGAWPGGQALIDDLATLLRTVSERHPDIPLTLIGHSMGGGVALATLGEGRAAVVDAAVLLAPAVWGGDTLPTRLRMATWLAAAIAPDTRLTGSGFVEVKPTDNNALLKQLSEDPFFLKYPSPREYMGVVRLMDRAVAAAETVETPLMVMYGAHDQIIPANAIKNAVARLPDGKTYVEYPDGWHMLLRDNQGPKVRQDVIAWINDTTATQTVARAIAN